MKKTIIILGILTVVSYFIYSQNKKYDRVIFFDKNGVLIATNSYGWESMIGENEKYLKVEINKKQGLIDRDGNELVPVIYDGIGFFFKG
jgi:hypothetical protein